MGGDPRRARDPDLLDALDARARVAYEGSLWRVVHQARSPIEPSNAGGRWDLGASEVLYTALDPDGAVAELEFHLSRQPVFPSKYPAVLYELKVTMTESLRFESLVQLEAFGVEASRYHDVLYERTQEIGDAAAFLGFDAVIAPSARWACLNAMLIMSSTGDRHQLQVVGQANVDWDDWRARHRRRTR